MKYYQVFISAENKEQADTILNPILEKKLATGGQIICSPARFLWKGKLTDMNYCNIIAFTTEEHKDELITEVEKHSVEEVPMISLNVIEGNKKLLDWIKDTLS